MIARRQSVWIASAVIVGVLVFITARCSWSSSSIEARVFDAATGEPLAEVIVVANWEVKGLEGYVDEQIAIFETLTDSFGHLRIPAWGPRFNFGIGVVRDDQPIVRFYRRGYIPLVVHNVPAPSSRDLSSASRRLHPALTGQSISLTPFSGSLGEYAQTLAPLQKSLDFAFSGRNCDWAKTPRMFMALDEIGRELEVLDVDFHGFRLEHLGGQERCGDARKEIEERVQ